MVRALAGYDWDRTQRVLRWPLREALLAFEQLLEKEALANYSQELTWWAQLAPHSKKRRKPPKPPRFLREGSKRRDRGRDRP